MKIVRKQEKTRQGCCWYFCCCFSLFLCLRIFPKCLRESFLQPFLLLFWGRWINRLRLWLVLVFIHRSLKNFRLLVWIKRPTSDVLVTYEASIMILDSIFVRMVTTTTSVSSEAVRAFQRRVQLCRKVEQSNTMKCAKSDADEKFATLFLRHTPRFSIGFSSTKKRKAFFFSWSIFRTSSYIHLNAIRCQNEINISVVETFAVINIKIFRAASNTGLIFDFTLIFKFKRMSFANFLPSEQSNRSIHKSQCKRMFVTVKNKSWTIGNISTVWSGLEWNGF